MNHIPGKTYSKNEQKNNDNDGDDNDDDYDKLFLWYGRPTRALFPLGNIARDSHNQEFPTRNQQGLNLRKI